MQVRLALLLPPSVNRPVSAMAKKLGKKYPSLFIVDSKKLFLHITLFLIEIPKPKLKLLEAAAKEFAAKNKVFKIKYNDLWSNDRGYLVLHNEPVKKIRNFRNKLAGLLEHRNFLPLVKVNAPFRPHITLTRYKKETDALRIVKSHPKVKRSFTVSEICICLSYPSGDKQDQVYKILKKFKLK
jgi:2'-5' RNA ligase